jgi:pyruvate dehydrogenase E1 component alpha subunit
LPAVLFLENNQYGLTVHLSRHVRETNLFRRAASFGMAAVQIDGNDVEAVYAVAVEAVRRARGGDGPTLIEAVTYRQSGFSTSDVGGYQSPDEARQWPDPLEITRQRLRERAISEAVLADIEQRCEADVDDAIAFAAASPWPELSELTEVS